MGCTEEDLLKMHNLSLITKKHQIILKERLQNNWPVLFRSIRVIKERVSDCHNEEMKPKETWNLNVVSDSELEPSWTRKGCLWDSEQNLWISNSWI